MTKMRLELLAAVWQKTKITLNPKMCLKMNTGPHPAQGHGSSSLLRGLGVWWSDELIANLLETIELQMSKFVSVRSRSSGQGYLKHLW